MESGSERLRLAGSAATRTTRDTRAPPALWLPASGGWGQLKYNSEKVSASLGYGIDRIDTETEGVSDTFRESNTWLFANTSYNVTNQLSYMLQYDLLTTAYVGQDEGKVGRLSFMALYKF